MEKMVSLKNVSKTFPVGKSLLGKPTKFVHAVNNVSFDVYAGETFSIVGESGCGKSTTGRLINHLLTPDSGEIWFQGKEISRISQDEMRPLRKDMQMIFQDPAGSLNPRMRVSELIEEPLLIHTNMNAQERAKVVNELLGIVGLSAKHAERFPHEFSGGQKQRIGIARALTVNPKLVIADEPVSALDVSIQAQVLNLMKDIQKEMNLTYLFIAHDLSVVQYMSDRIVVMYLGKIVEIADSKALYDNPLHPYTKALLSAIPVPDIHNRKKRQVLEGEVPSPINKPTGCAFHNRCPHCMEICRQVDPATIQCGEEGHMVACHLYDKKD